MKVALFQNPIRFKDKKANIDSFLRLADTLPKGVGVVVLPEMFSTGFCPQCLELAEPVEGETMQTLVRVARNKGFAIVGSFMCIDNDKFYNRGFFIFPDGKIIYTDKAHLYSHGGEDACFVPGIGRDIITYRDVKFRLVICYDLRFPIWCRNDKSNLYDFLVVIANWPDVRIKYWDILLRARAIENQSFVIGVNMVGEDLQGLHYSGHSVALNTYLEDLAGFGENETGCRIVDFDIAALHHFRQTLPLWKDMDDFTIIHRNLHK